MAKVLFILAFAFVGIVTTNSANAQTIRYVKPTATGVGNGIAWTNASDDIQGMIDASVSGDQVWIARGNYPLTATLEMKEGVNVYGGFFGDETSISSRQKEDLDENGIVEAWEFSFATVLNGQNERRVLHQQSPFDIETLWDGVTIMRGSVSSNTSDANGGGAYIKTNGKLINCVVSNNTASIVSTGYTFNCSRGGGLYNQGGTISQCFISNNTSTANTSITGDKSCGGGIYNDSGTISQCLISNNTCHVSCSSGGSFNNLAKAYGGGIYNGNGIISHCTISDNTYTLQGTNTSIYGIGIACSSTTYSIVTDCIIKNNMGGIYQGNINRCVIRENNCPCYFENSIASNCLIVDNNSSSGYSDYGACGGIYTNCNFLQNAHGITGSSDNPVTAVNCIIWGNSIDQIRGSYVTITYSAIQGGYTGDGNINIAADNTVGGPRFVNPEEDNYQLQSTSPCINAGNNTALSANDTIDMAGLSRIYDGTVDMGCYEWQPTHIISGQVTSKENYPIIIYPNPTKDILSVECENVNVIKLYDILGKEMLTQTVNGKTEINIKHLPKGMYIINVVSEGKFIGNSKIVKQ